MNIKTMNNLKADTDTLRQELNILNADITDLRYDNQSINEVINARSSEIARLKAEISDVFDSSNRINNERKELENMVS